MRSQSPGLPRAPVMASLLFAMMLTGSPRPAAVERAPGSAPAACAEALPPAGAAAVEPVVSRPVSGLDVRLHVGRYRIRVPWLDTLPITPGHRIVISILSWDLAGP